MAIIKGPGTPKAAIIALAGALAITSSACDSSPSQLRRDRLRPAPTAALSPDTAKHTASNALDNLPLRFEQASTNVPFVARAAGFDVSQPAIVVSTGVSMYLSKEANAATLRQVASLAPGSMLAMTFLLPLEKADPDVRPGLEMAEKGAHASGTPFISSWLRYPSVTENEPSTRRTRSPVRTRSFSVWMTGRPAPTVVS